jgi:hypothetical protein
LLGCIPTNVLRTSSDLAWIGGLVRHVLGSQSVGHIECPAAVAHWIAKRIGEGALSSTVGGALQEDLREAWRGIFRTLPAAWLVDAPVTSQQAVVELASQGFFGDGLLPIPFGLRQETACTSRPNQERLERSLLKLGKRLEEDVDGSQHTHHSRLLLAETFLSVREERTLGEELSKLPLLRATKLPEEKDEAWSVEQLNRQTELRRVFSRPTGDDGDNLIVQDSPSDPKRAVKDLAEALNENTWLVYDTVASISHAPIPTTAALSVAVLHMGSIQSAPEQRIRLVQRLAEDASNPIVRRAIRTLLTGRGSEVEEERRLYYVRSQDSDKDANRKTLGILLRLLGLSWCAIEPGLVEPLPLALVEDLHVKTLPKGPTGLGSSSWKYCTFSCPCTEPHPTIVRGGARCLSIDELGATADALTNELFALLVSCVSRRGLSPKSCCSTPIAKWPISTLTFRPSTMTAFSARCS